MRENARMKGPPAKAAKRHLVLYTAMLSAGGVKQYARERAKGGGEVMTDLVWQEVGILLSSGAIGSLLVWGYQNWLKR